LSGVLLFDLLSLRRLLLDLDLSGADGLAFYFCFRTGDGIRLIGGDASLFSSVSGGVSSSSGSLNGSTFLVGEG